jgi:hypothetical protein
VVHLLIVVTAGRSAVVAVENADVPVACSGLAAVLVGPVVVRGVGATVVTDDATAVALVHAGLVQCDQLQVLLRMDSHVSPPLVGLVVREGYWLDSAAARRLLVVLLVLDH